MFQDIEQLFDEINSKKFVSSNHENKVQNLNSNESNKSLDKLFDSLTSDVTGATSFITKVIKRYFI